MTDKGLNALKKVIWFSIFAIVLVSGVIMARVITGGRARGGPSSVVTQDSGQQGSGPAVTGPTGTGTGAAKDSGTATGTGTSAAGTSSTTVKKTTATTTTAKVTTTKSDSVGERISKMSLHEKVCQLFVVTPEGLTNWENHSVAGQFTRAGLKDYPVGGLVYFAFNIDSADAVKEMLSKTKEYAKEHGMVQPFLAVDEEGGTVARCAQKAGTTTFNSMYYYRGEGKDKAHDNAKVIGADIASLGFNLDFAPVADTWSNNNNTVIGVRAYSDNFAQAAELIPSAVKGFHDGGVYCTLKHFPGHGDTSGDSHYGAVYSAKTLEQLEKEEYLPFISGIKAGADMVMLGHITMTSVDNQPATFSEKMIKDQLRGKLGFDGVVITDSLQMRAVTDLYPDGEASVRAFLAGADMLLMPADLPTAVTAVENAVKDKRISEERLDESLRRILELKAKKTDIKKS